jgi:RNA polymerase sigma-70 factor (ECF subfamily)
LNSEPSNSSQRASLAELDARYRVALMSFFKRRVQSRAEAEDLTQDVLLRVVQSADRPNFELADGLIFTVATNLLRDRARRLKTRGGELHVQIGSDVERDPDRSLIEDIEPEHVLLSREMLARALHALQDLAPRTRQVFVLYRLEGLRQKEIAHLLGISASSVEKHVCKALAHLSEMLGKA